MIILNETTIIDASIKDEWLIWMKAVHIPAVMATGYFNSYQLLHVVSSPNEGITYCIQYITDSMPQFNAFNEKYSPYLRNNHLKQFENKVVQFESIMQTIEL